MNLNHSDKALRYMGKKINTKYFEGWYFKQVSVDLKYTISVIPGISKNPKEAHAFIQIIINKNSDGNSTHETYYHKFSTDEFKYSDRPFYLKIRNNKFCRDSIELDLSSDNHSLSGKIFFSNFTEIKTTTIYPNAMGYFAFIPFMECYHDIISMNHYLNGLLYLNKNSIDFNLGKGYIEKDWGTSFPKEYIWIQSNNFKDSDASIMCSIADIPFFNTSFQGFICNVSINNQEYRFASYNNSKIVNFNYNNNMLNIIIVKGKLKLDVSAKICDDGGILKAPSNGNMSVIIKEGLSGVINIKLLKNSEIVYSGIGYPCGIELFNIYEMLKHY